MNAVLLASKWLAILLIFSGSLVSQSSLLLAQENRFAEEFPQLSQAVSQGDVAAIRAALEKLDPASKQRVLTILHSQRVQPGVARSGTDSSSSNLSQTSSPVAPSSGGPGSPLGEGTNGGSGGGSLANFSELMNLIQSTISPDIWLNAGGNATMSPFRQGVRITTDGVIERISNVKQSGAPKLRNIPQELAQGEPLAVSLDDLGHWQQPSDLRWISLKSLDDQLHARAQEGQRSTIAMELIGGLARIDYLAWDPNSSDWLIGGPAGDFAANRQGDLIHRELKLPPILLEDALTVSHHVLNAKGEFGCSIDPVPEKLVAAYQMANDKASVRLLSRDPEAWVAQWKEKLGFQKTNIVGIAPDSPTGYALVVADAHMKRLAFGLELSVQGLSNYWMESERLGYAKEQSMVRWWFAMSGSPIGFDPDQQIYQFEKSNVAVLSETQMMLTDGSRVASQLPDRAADAFAKNFTKHFESLQKTYPIYGRLRHIFDLAVVMEIIRSESLDESHRIEFKVLGNPKYLPHLDIAPTQIDSIVATRKRSDGSTSAIVSGGVSIEPRAVQGKLRLDRDLKNRVSLDKSPGEEPQTPPYRAFEERFWK